MIAPTLAPIAGKLARLVRLLASDKPGEVNAAAAAIVRTLRSAGGDIHLLAAHVEGAEPPTAAYSAGAGRRRPDHRDFHHAGAAPDWAAIAGFCVGRAARLTDRERAFVENVALWISSGGEPSERQGAWLRAIRARLGGRRA